MESKKPIRMSEATKEIWMVPFFGQGHLLPSMELCKHLASRNFKTTFLITSNLSSSIPSSFQQNPLLQVAELTSSLPPPPPPPERQQPGSDPIVDFRRQYIQMAKELEDLISTRISDSGPGLPVCAVTDIMMSWAAEVFNKFDVPVVKFFTSGACSAAMEYAIWKEKIVGNLKPWETRLLPGLPDEMAITESDLKRRPHGQPGGPPPPPGPAGGFLPFGGGSGGGGTEPKMKGPPELGQQPPWLEETEEAIALMINTCHELEGPFLEYLTKQVGKPVWAVGPQLPEQYWKSAGSILRDREFRSNRQSSVTEDEVVSWLDSKPRGSVLYVSFGSEVGPEMRELSQLADALEASDRPFIWVIQPNSGRCGPPGQFPGGKPGSVGAEEGYFPHGLDQKVGDRGSIIRGWAPQLLILSHPSTGGFLSHCGWNSTVEAIGRGVPLLAWPIRGDQYFNADLVAKYLGVGRMIAEDMSQTVKKDDIVKGIESLLGNEDVKKQAIQLETKFEHGFPGSSVAYLDAFRDFIITQKSRLSKGHCTSCC